MVKFKYEITEHCLKIVKSVISVGHKHNCDISEFYIEDSFITTSGIKELKEFGVDAQEVKDSDGTGISLSWVGGEAKIPDEWYE